MNNLLWMIITILFVLWLFGLVMKIGGKLINLVLVVVLILFIYNLLNGFHGAH